MMEILDLKRSPLVEKESKLENKNFQLIKMNKQPMKDVLNTFQANQTARNTHDPSKAPTVVMFTATCDLTEEEKSRLWHWRLGHSNPNVLISMEGIGVTFKLQDKCYCCARTSMSTPKGMLIDTNYVEPDFLSTRAKFSRIHVVRYGAKHGPFDKDGNQTSTHHTGANAGPQVSGYIFMDPSTGTIRRKFNGKGRGFPAILDEFLQDVETAHCKTRDIVLDMSEVGITHEVKAVARRWNVDIAHIYDLKFRNWPGTSSGA
jgi:hypothetical protein